MNLIFVILKISTVFLLHYSLTPMEFKGREQRNECYSARDAYFDCLESKQETGTTTITDSSEGPCKELFAKFEKNCGKKWTEHFIRRRGYLKFKEKLEKEGAEAIDKKLLK